MVGIALMVFVRSHLKPSVRDVQKAHVPTGKSVPGNKGTRLGNKGAVTVRFTVCDTSLCFVSSHLAANTHKWSQRNANVADVFAAAPFLREKRLGPVLSHYQREHNNSAVLSHHHKEPTSPTLLDEEHQPSSDLEKMAGKSSLSDEAATKKSQTHRSRIFTFHRGSGRRATESAWESTVGRLSSSGKAKKQATTDGGAAEKGWAVLEPLHQAEVPAKSPFERIVERHKDNKGPSAKQGGRGSGDKNLLKPILRNEGGSGLDQGNGSDASSATFGFLDGHSAEKMARKRLETAEKRLDHFGVLDHDLVRCCKIFKQYVCL